MRCTPGCSAAVRSIVPTPSMAISPRSRWMSFRLTTPVSSVKLPPGVRALERDQELVAARRRIADGQDRHRRSSLRRFFERAAGDRLQLVTGRQVHGQRAQLALRDVDVDQRHHAHVGIVERDERHDLGERAHILRRRDRRAVAHRPPHFRGRARIERGFDDGAAVGDGAARDQPRREPNIRLFARQIDRRPRGAGLRHRQDERAAARA